VTNLKVIDADLADVFGDIARLHIQHRDASKAGRIIVLSTGGKKAYAVARGLRKGMTKEEISLDSALRKRLGVEKNDTYDFAIEPAGFWGELVWAWKSTDAYPRIAARLGAISIGLGGAGLVLGIISLCNG
jgi:hypothetical protein